MLYGNPGSIAKEKQVFYNIKQSEKFENSILFFQLLINFIIINKTEYSIKKAYHGYTLKSLSV